MRTCEWEQGGLKRIIDVCCSKQLLPSTKNAAFVYVPTYLPTYAEQSLLRPRAAQMNVSAKSKMLFNYLPIYTGGNILADAL